MTNIDWFHTGHLHLSFRLVSFW